MENLEYWKKEWIKVGKEYILNKNTEDKNIKVWDESSKIMMKQLVIIELRML